MLFVDAAKLQTDADESRRAAEHAHDGASRVRAHQQTLGDEVTMVAGDFTETQRSNAALLRAVPCSYDT